MSKAIQIGYSISVSEADSYKTISDAMTEHNSSVSPGDVYWGISMKDGVYTIIAGNTVPEPLSETEQMEALRQQKLKEVSDACESVICGGVDMEFDEGQTEHFSLTPNDQTNIDGIFSAITLGATAYPYHADNGACKMYTAKNIVNLYVAVKSFITQQTTYNNALRRWIRQENDMDVLRNISYGIELPEDLKNEMDTILEQAQTEISAIVAKLSQ